MSDSLQPHGLQHTRLPCPSLSISWSLLKLMFIEFVMFSSISSSATPFSFCLQSFPASGSFPVSRLFASGGQSIGTSASVLPMNIQSWFPLELTGLISLLSGDSQEYCLAPQFESINYLPLSLLYGPTLNPYMATGKTILWLYWSCLANWSLCFLICCRDLS